MAKIKEKIIEVKEELPAAETPLEPTIQSMDQLTSSEALPEVQEHSIAAVQADNAQKIEAAQGDGFDKNVHASNTDGSPKLTAAGNFAKKRGRKSVLNTGQKTAKQEQAENEAIKAEAENKQSAAVISAILEQLQMKMISEEFAYSELERVTNQAAWEMTLEYYGGLNVPPPLQLIMDHMTIILSRAQKPLTKDKLGHVKLWFKNKFKRKKKNALSDNRKDTKRENDVREEESA